MMIAHRRIIALFLSFAVAILLLLGSFSSTAGAAPASTSSSKPRSRGGAESKLSKLGVDDATQRAIAGMAKSGISHDKIVDNMRNHFPDLRDHELNDIVVAANIAQQSRQARGAMPKQRKR